MLPMRQFMFATGIENSYPVIAGPNGTRRRVDEMEKCRHYEHWKQDFQLVKDLGIQYLRYGPTDHPLLPHLTDRFRLLLWAQFVVVFTGLWSFVVYYQDYYVNEMEPIQNLVASGSLLAAAVLR